MVVMHHGAAFSGEVDTLLESYDRERDNLPPPTPLFWEWGWTTSAEIWNGRLAMVAVLLILAMETRTGQGVLSRVFLSFLPSWTLFQHLAWDLRFFDVICKNECFESAPLISLCCRSAFQVALFYIPWGDRTNDYVLILERRRDQTRCATGAWGQE